MDGMGISGRYEVQKEMSYQMGWAFLDKDGYLWWHEVQRTAQCNITR